MKKGILIPGLNPIKRNWQEVIWGIPPHKPGRIVKGISMCLKDPTIRIVLFFGMIKDWLLHQTQFIDQFAVFQEFKNKDEEILKIVETKFRCIERVKNTHENVEAMESVIREMDLDEIIIISSPDHVFRAMKLFIEYFETIEDLSYLTIRLSGCPSAVYYSGKEMKDLTIIEP